MKTHKTEPGSVASHQRFPLRRLPEGWKVTSITSTGMRGEPRILLSYDVEDPVLGRIEAFVTSQYVLEEGFRWEDPLSYKRVWSSSFGRWDDLSQACAEALERQRGRAWGEVVRSYISDLSPSLAPGEVRLPDALGGHVVRKLSGVRLEQGSAHPMKLTSEVFPEYFAPSTWEDLKHFPEFRPVRFEAFLGRLSPSVREQLQWSPEESWFQLRFPDGTEIPVRAEVAFYLGQVQSVSELRASGDLLCGRVELKDGTVHPNARVGTGYLCTALGMQAPQLDWDFPGLCVQLAKLDLKRPTPREVYERMPASSGIAFFQRWWELSQQASEIKVVGDIELGLEVCVDGVWSPFPGDLSFGDRINFRTREIVLGVSKAPEPLQHFRSTIRYMLKGRVEHRVAVACRGGFMTWAESMRSEALLLKELGF